MLTPSLVNMYLRFIIIFTFVMKSILCNVKQPIRVLRAPLVFTSGCFTAYYNNMKSELIILCNRIKNRYTYFSRVSPKWNDGDECLTLICSGEFRTRWTSTAPRTRSHVLTDEYIIKINIYIKYSLYCVCVSRDP